MVSVQEFNKETPVKKVRGNQAMGRTLEPMERVMFVM